MGRVIKLKDVKKFIKPHESVLVGGVFDLFHIGHLTFLKDCAKLGRPLVVIVQSDKTVTLRKGFNRPIIKQSSRAGIVAALEFVDFVLILDKPSHYDSYLQTISPKIYVFSKENMIYRLNRAKLIKKNFPKLKVKFVSR